MNGIYKIVSVSTPTTITRKDGTNCQKTIIVLRELGGKYEDQYVTTWISETPCPLSPETTIAAALRFTARNYDGQDYQDILLQEYTVLSSLVTLPKMSVL